MSVCLIYVQVVYICGKLNKRHNNNQVKCTNYKSSFVLLWCLEALSSERC